MPAAHQASGQAQVEGGTILDAFGSPIAARHPTLATPEARYEGAMFSTARSQWPTVIQSARKDLAPGTRRRLLALSRYLVKNNPLVSAIVERLVIYSVGTGITPEPASSDRAWNDRAARVWEGWARRASLTTRQTYGQLQAVMLRAAIVDGDCFELRTYSTSGRPRVQLIESHEIGDPDAAAPDDTTDGVIFDPQGRPSGYRMPAGAGIDPETKAPRERILDAATVSMLADLRRPNQHRAPCLLASALTTAIDLHDILALEKAGVKAAGSIENVVTTATGEVDADDLIRRGGGSTPASDPARYYREVIGTETKILKSGDTMTQYVNQRPSGAWIGFVDFMAELCCLALNLPPSMVRQLKVGGADTRRDLSTMQRVCEPWQELVAGIAQEDFEYVIGAEIEDGALDGAPPDWRSTSMQFPRAPTVDAGRMAQQDREDVRSGTLTMQEYCGQWGTNYRRHFQQLDRELAELNPAFTPQQRAEILTRRLYGEQAQVAPATA
jgi:hypothetical protein